MPRPIAFLAAAALPCVLLTSLASGESLSVKLRPGVDAATAWTWLSQQEVGRRLVAPEPLFRVAPANATRAQEHGLDRWMRVGLRQSRDAQSVAAALGSVDLLFECVEVPSRVELGEGEPPLPNDPSFGLQYGMHNTGQTIQGTAGLVDADCDAPEAWAMGAVPPVIVGVVDGGVFLHEELAGRVLPGWNVLTQSPDTTDVCSSHGTHVSGIIAAKRNNGRGVAGMNDTALILPVRVFDSTCFGEWTTISEGLVWAADHGARIINISIHGYDFEQVLEDAVNYCYDAGSLVVAIAGNGNQNVAYPGKLDHALAVAATNNLDVRASFSNNGPEVEIAAPGQSIYSCTQTASYGYKSGTSMAAPHVSGLAAILLGSAPWLGPDGLWSVIRDSADDVDAPGFDENTGWGRINAPAARLELAARLAAGDLDANGSVAAPDLAILLGAWGSSGPGDLDGDGTVGPADVAALLAAWSG